MIDITFMSKCADSEFKISDNSIAGDLNQSHVLIIILHRIKINSRDKTWISISHV